MKKQVDMQEEAPVEVVRAGQVESRHHASLAVVDIEGHLLAAWGDPDLVTFLRSSAKPFQAIPFVESGAADHFKFEPRELALVCASHTGSEMHVDLAVRLFNKIGVSEKALKCGTHIPYDETAYEDLLRAGGVVEPIRNNCSGKHAGMLALAKHLGAEVDSYLDSDHPVQEKIQRVFAELTGLPIESIVVGVDGCSAPTFAIPLSATAKAYARFVDFLNDNKPHRKACRRVFEAMTRHPEFVAGPSRFDTLFMQTVDGRMVSKSGAEGFQALGIPGNVLRDGSPPLGIAIKIHDGDHKDHRAAALIAIEVVERLGGFNSGERSALNSFDERVIKNLAGIEVGEVRMSTAFRRNFKINHERI